MDTFIESSSVRMKPAEDGSHNTLYNEKKWEWSFLRRKCRNLELEQFYDSYMQRLRISFISLFIFIGGLVALVHSIIILVSVQPISDVPWFDIGMYLGAAVLVWVVLSINFCEERISRNTWIMYATSWVATTILVAADLGVPIYHASQNHDILRPTYGSYILYAIYIFMPLPNNFHALILGLAISASYLVCYGFVTYRKLEENVDKLDTTKLLSEGIFLLCINLLGIYFRLMKEIAIRTTFLDRRQCVEENLLLRYARDQERSLLLSIIPAQIANKIEQDVKIRIEHIKQQNQSRFSNSSVEPRGSPKIVKRWRQPDTEKLFIEPHNDVSILYADVVNYTALTTTLDVKTLVETIHDLFVKFDTASEEYNVLRIKFLGDCYYCVAGVPIPNEDHAKCCVLLGLRMIKDIREVRQKRQLGIDMRIGVHSGNILSGVIGANKWQFDIWSKDVDVANRLESTGVAGRVHVSEQTLKLLEGEFIYEEGTEKARDDEVLRKYQIRTFLIKPPKGSTMYISSKNQAHQGKQGVNFRNSVGVRRYMDTVPPKIDPSSNFMQNTISQYNQIRAQAKLEMNRELDKMPIGRIQFSKVCFGHSKRLTQDEMEEQSFRSNITSLFLFFKDWRWEVLYMKEPDVMLKYSVLFSVIIFFGIMVTQAINEKLSLTVWICNIVNSVLMVFFLIIVWYRKLWIMLVAEAENSLPKNKISAFIYKLSDKVQSNILARVIGFLAMVTMHCMCAMMQFVDCNRHQIENEEIDLQLFNDEERPNLCFNTWAVTEDLTLTICMCFLFTRIPFVLKLATGFLIVCLYAIMVQLEFNFIYEKSLSTNVGLFPEYSHILMLIITLAIFHLMDRQTEFISKVDYNWKRQLQKKQDDAKITNETIKILINNILPSHVADIYITKQMKNELYYEEYDNVAVMFATIKNYDTEKVGLRVLNEIICDFDAVLNSYKGLLKIEKIKVAGWTYMAACGLDIARSESSIGTNRSSSLLPTGRRSHHDSSSSSSQDTVLDMPPSTSRNSSLAAYEGHNTENKKKRKISSPQQSNVVFVMAQFALDLMRTMHAFNAENLQYEDGDKGQGMLSIGISNGEIMAGVVGSYKPHYDIWGNAVNMASRMDSTGKPGKIQVTEETATILRTFDIHCAYRGETYVKGRGKIPTYFIAIDKNLNFTPIADALSTMSGISLVPAAQPKLNPEMDNMYVNKSSISQTPSEELIEKKMSDAEKEIRDSPKLVLEVPEKPDEWKSKLEAAAQKAALEEDALEKEEASEEPEAEEAEAEEAEAEEAEAEEAEAEGAKLETAEPAEVSSAEASSEELLSIVKTDGAEPIESTSLKSEHKEETSIVAESIADAPLEAPPLKKLSPEAAPVIDILETTTEESRSKTQNVATDVMKIGSNATLDGLSLNIVVSDVKLKKYQDSASKVPKTSISEPEIPIPEVSKPGVSKHEVSKPTVSRPAVPKPEVAKPVLPKPASLTTVYYSDISDTEIVRKPAAPKPTVTKTKGTKPGDLSEQAASNMTLYFSDISDEDLVSKPKVIKPVVAKPEVPKTVVPKTNSKETLYFSDMSDIDSISKPNDVKPKVSKTEVTKPDDLKADSKNTLYFSNESDDDLVSTSSERFYDTLSNDELIQSKSKKK